MVAEVDSKAYDSKYFETVCDGWREFKEGKIGERLEKAARLAKTDFSGKRVLDIGFGRGELLIALAKKGAFCVGIDYAEAGVEIARKAAKAQKVSVQFERKSVTEFDFEPDSFDVVFMLDIVEHLTDEQLQICFEKVRKVLAPGGVFVVHTMPNRFLAAPFYFVSAVTKTKRGVNEEVHINEQTPFSLRGKLSDFDVDIFLAHQKNYFKNTQFYASHRKAIRPFVDVFLTHDFSKIPLLNNFLAAEIWAVCRKKNQKGE